MACSGKTAKLESAPYVEHDTNIKAEHTTREDNECTDAMYEEQMMAKQKEQVYTSPKKHKQVQFQRQTSPCEQARVKPLKPSGGKPYIKRMLEDLNKETKEFGIANDVRIVIGSGGMIQQVMTHCHFHTVVARGPHHGKWIKEVKILLAKYGGVMKQSSKQFDANCCLFVTYQNPADAQRAVSKCYYPQVTIQPWKTEQFTLKLEWQRRQRDNYALISFDSPMHVQYALQCLSYGVFIFGHKAKIQLCKNDRSKLILRGRHMQTVSERYLREIISCKIGSTVPFRLTMGYLRCETSDKEYEDYRQELRNIIAKHVNPGTYSITFPKPEPVHIYFQAYIHFDSPEEGYKAFESGLNDESIGRGKPLCVMVSLQSKVLYQKWIFDLIQTSLEEYQSHLLKCYPKGLQIEIIKPNKQNEKFASVVIKCDNVNTFAVAQNVLNSVAKPHVMECKTPELQQYILSSAYREQLEMIQANTCTYIRTDRRSMCVKIFGTEGNRAKAKAKIERGAGALYSGGAKQVQLKLGSSKQPPGLMKCLVTRYGSELEGMLQMEGVRVVTLNPNRQVISLLATSQGQEAVKKVIEEYSGPVQAEVRQTEFEVKCSACLALIESPEQVIRLKCCGHAYHTSCIELQLKPNTIVFPVQCASEGCSQNFVWQDFENLHKRCDFRVGDLVSTSLKDYLDRHGDKYKNCPTPDCQTVYTVTEVGMPFSCSHCGVTTCTACHEQYHSGISCEMYRTGKAGGKKFKQQMPYCRASGAGWPLPSPMYVGLLAPKTTPPAQSPLPIQDRLHGGSSQQKKLARRRSPRSKTMPSAQPLRGNDQLSGRPAQGGVLTCIIVMLIMIYILWYYRL